MAKGKNSSTKYQGKENTTRHSTITHEEVNKQNATINDYDGQEHLNQTMDKQWVYIIENTDNKKSIPAGNGLNETRRNRIVASLGEKSEMVSIVVQAFNRLDKTRKCVENILKYTSDIDYELILIDNGSTDGTLEYFKSVDHPIKTVVNITKNISSYVPLIYPLRGMYIVNITNDTYVTKDWLKNLLICMKSDDTIGMAVPTVSNGSNMQGADITFNSLEEMEEKAAKFNVSNPCVWHERMRLVYQLVIYRREIFDIVGIIDYGFFHDFVEDDISFRIRRAGYKTVLCKDTFVHHDHVRHNMSPSELENFNNSIEAGKRDFRNKYYGVDAWDDVNNYEPNIMAMVNPKEHDSDKEINILGVDVLCGSPILELKNKLRENYIFNPYLSGFSTDPKYWLDLKTICNKEVVVDKIEQFNQYFSNESFDYIILGKPINFYSNSFQLVNYLIKRLKSKGHLYLKLYNSFDFTNLIKSLGGNFNSGRINEVGLYYFNYSIDDLMSELDRLGFKSNKTIAENWPMDSNFHSFVKKIVDTSSINPNKSITLARSTVKNYCLDIIAK
jgi:GT2 family glycosyltransferase